MEVDLRKPQKVFPKSEYIRKSALCKTSTPDLRDFSGRSTSTTNVFRRRESITGPAQDTHFPPQGIFKVDVHAPPEVFRKKENTKTSRIGHPFKIQRIFNVVT